MALVKLPISTGQHSNTNERSNKDAAQLLVNLVIDEHGNNRSRPGLSRTATPADRILSMVEFGDYILGIGENRRAYRISQDDTTADVTGDLIAGTAIPGFAVDDSTPGILHITGGGGVYTWDGSGTTKALATTATSSPPPRATHIVLADRYLVANDAATDLIYYRPPAGDWNTAANFFRAESLGDPCIALHSLFGEIYAFGSDTIEVFHTTGDAVTPFARTMVIERGLGATRGVVVADNGLFFIDSERRIIQLQARAPQVISLPIEADIQALGRIDDCIANVVEIGGLHLIVFHFPDAKKAFVYDYARKYWAEWRGWVDGEWSALVWGAHVWHSRWNEHTVANRLNANLYNLSFAHYDDAGTVMRRLRRTAYVDGGASIRKRLNLLRIRAERGSTSTLVSSSAGYNPQMEVRFRHDAGAWSDYRRISLGRVGDNTLYGEIRKLGIARATELEVSFSEATPFTLTGLELDIDVMLS